MNPFASGQGIFIIIILVMVVLTGGFTMQELVFGLPAVIIALSFHEFAHAWTAVKLGDDTPKFQGRLTVDIRKHVDPIGLIVFLVAGFGWAKPVETDPRNLNNPKRDMGLISVAGPLMNIIIFLIVFVIGAKLGKLGYENNIFPTDKFGVLLYFIAMYNVYLAIFNLIPIPPLDGSKILKAFLPNKSYYKFSEIEYKYQIPMMFGLLALIFLIPGFLIGVINFFVTPITYIGLTIANLLPF